MASTTNLLRWKVFAILMSMLLAPISIAAQNADYRIVSTESVQSLSVKIRLVVYCKDKKYVDAEAQKAALRVIMFDGCPNTQYIKPLLEEGQRTSEQNNSYYFGDLFDNRFKDFVSNVTSLSKFKKADDKKGTEYEITVKASLLRKDLEKNNIRKKIGL